LEACPKQFGKESENLAASYLKDKGFIILTQNYRYKKAEIDIIARKNNCLYFVEVKARKNTKFGYPEEFVTSYKQRLLKKAAENYILEHHWNEPIRFDIIAILQQEDVVELVHFEDAFS